MQKSFSDSILEIEEEAKKEGAKAVLELARLREYYSKERNRIQKEIRIIKIVFGLIFIAACVNLAALLSK